MSELPEPSNDSIEEVSSREPPKPPLLIRYKDHIYQRLQVPRKPDQGRPIKEVQSD